MDLSFVPIARRDLKYVSSPTVSLHVILALSAPYRPPKEPGQGAAACMVLDCDDPGLAMEICGEDEFEALQLALMHLEKFIDSLSKSNAGELQNLDGTPFKPTKASLYAHYLSKSTVGQS